MDRSVEGTASARATLNRSLALEASLPERVRDYVRGLGTYGSCVVTGAIWDSGSIGLTSCGCCFPARPRCSGQSACAALHRRQVGFVWDGSGCRCGRCCKLGCREIVLDLVTPPFTFFPRRPVLALWGFARRSMLDYESDRGGWRGERRTVDMAGSWIAR